MSEWEQEGGQGGGEQGGGSEGEGGGMGGDGSDGEGGGGEQGGGGAIDIEENEPSPHQGEEGQEPI